MTDTPDPIPSARPDQGARMTTTDVYDVARWCLYATDCIHDIERALERHENGLAVAITREKAAKAAQEQTGHSQPKDNT